MYTSYDAGGAVLQRQVQWQYLYLNVRGVFLESKFFVCRKFTTFKHMRNCTSQIANPNFSDRSNIPSASSVLIMIGFVEKQCFVFGYLEPKFVKYSSLFPNKFTIY